MLFVIDGILRRVTVFSIRSVPPRLLRDASLNGGAGSDVCELRGSLYVLGLASDNTPVQEYSIEGDRLTWRRGIGALDFDHPLAGNPLFGPPFASGSLACLRESSEVVWASSYLGELRFIRVDAGARQAAVKAP